MSDADFSLIDLFQEEVRVHAGMLNQGLLELESDPANVQRIEPLMRAAHSIKGAARIVGIDLAVQLAHVMEDVFVAAQERRVAISSADVDDLLRGADLLLELSEGNEASLHDWTARHAADVAALQQVFLALAQGRPAPIPPPSQPLKSRSPSIRPPLGIPDQPILPGDDSPLFDLFREEVRRQGLALEAALREPAAIAADPAHLESLVLSARGIRGAARIVGIVSAAKLAQAMEETLAPVFEGRRQLAEETVDGLWQALELLAELIPASEKTLPAWLARREADVAAVCERLSFIPEELSQTPVIEAAVAPPNEPAAAAPSMASSEPAAAPMQPAATMPAEASGAVVRVSAQSLNRLMGLAGESLVQARWLQPFATSLLKLKKHQDHLADLLDGLAQSRTTGGPARSDDRLDELVAEARGRISRCRRVLADRIGEFDDHAAQAEDLNTRLYREAIASRMRPFSDGAHGFPRLVRDMARQLNKHVRLEIDGLAAEVDRDVLEKLEAPLTHLLRNAVDHGIESPERRLAANKPESGLVKLEVRHRAGMLAITIADDGGGVDLARLRAKIVERGLTTAEMAQTMTAAEVLEFLFLPGFSTAPALTEYSGRGVGLDVVQQTVRRIGGSVRISTRQGQGTSFHLQLPITLSVLRAVLVEIAGEPYAFPHNRIDRLIRVPQAELRSVENRQFVSIDGQNIGLIVAAQLLGAAQPPTDATELTVLLLSDSVGQYGLIVDAFRGEQDLVVRPLDPRLGKVPNVSAAAILDDGSPVLIADVEDLIRSTDQFVQQGALRRFTRETRVEGAKKRVLVVDDSITVREVERQILRSQGYDVTVAVDGQEGWNMIRSEPFDLVVSDVDMPRLNGLELVRLIRAEASLRNLPVIIVSYKERQEDRLRGLEAGANAYLTKSSFHDNTFLQAVEDAVGEA